MEFSSPYVNSKKKCAPGGGAGGRITEGTAIPNVVKAKFGHLKARHETFAGEPVRCKGADCEAILTSYSSLSDPNPATGKRTWKCEFCRFENNLKIGDGEIPSDEVTFFLSPAPHEPGSTLLTSLASVDMKYYVYCIDISGSMCITTAVNSAVKLPSDKIRKEMRDKIESAVVDGVRPFIPPVYQPHRHISRLEAVQVAIVDSLKKIERDNPEKRVVLTTFNGQVTIVGDGKAEQLEIKDDQLEDEETIRACVQRSPLYNNVALNKGMLRERVLNLEEGGQTALGPALLYSVQLAARKPGGQVLLCTDGLANLGLGRLDFDKVTNEFHKKRAIDEANLFYQSIIDLALQKGVSISVVTIEGTNCKLGILGEVATKTGGSVKIVDPLKLKDEFTSLVEEDLVATNVEGTFILPKEFYIDNHEDPTIKVNRIVKKIGNVTEETEVSFSFSIREDAQLKSSHMPVQLQLKYIAQDGSELLKVITKLQQVTDNEELVEQSVDKKIIASYVIRTQSELIQKGVQNEEIDNLALKVPSIKSQKADKFDEEVYRNVQRDIANVSSNVSNSVGRIKKVKADGTIASHAATAAHGGAAAAAAAAAVTENESVYVKSSKNEKNIVEPEMLNCLVNVDDSTASTNSKYRKFNSDMLESKKK